MNLINAMKNIARRVYQNDQKVGDLKKLTTTQKTSIVVAINALVTDLAARENVSEERVNQIISAKISELTNGASDTYDTFKELEEKIKADGSTVATLLTEIGVAKAKNEALSTELAALKAYVGYEQRETIEAEITRLMNTGA